MKDLLKVAEILIIRKHQTIEADIIHAIHIGIALEIQMNFYGTFQMSPKLYYCTEIQK